MIGDVFGVFLVFGDVKEDDVSSFFCRKAFGFEHIEMIDAEFITDGFEAIQDKRVNSSGFVKDGDAIEREGFGIAFECDSVFEAGTTAELFFVEVCDAFPHLVAILFDAEEVSSEGDLANGDRCFSDKSLIVVDFCVVGCRIKGKRVVGAALHPIAYRVEVFDKLFRILAFIGLVFGIELCSADNVFAGFRAISHLKVGETVEQVEFGKEVGVGHPIFDVGGEFVGFFECFERKSGIAGLIEGAEFLAFFEVTSKVGDADLCFAVDGLDVV